MGFETYDINNTRKYHNALWRWKYSKLHFVPQQRWHTWVVSLGKFSFRCRLPTEREYCIGRNRISMETDFTGESWGKQRKIRIRILPPLVFRRKVFIRNKLKSKYGKKSSAELLTFVTLSSSQVYFRQPSHTWPFRVLLTFLKGTWVAFPIAIDTKSIASLLVNNMPNETTFRNCFL